MVDVRDDQPQHEKGRRQRPRNGDPSAREIVYRHIFSRDEDRAIALSHARPARQKHVEVGDIGIGVKRERCQFVFAHQSAAVERFDVSEDMLEAKAFGGNLPLRERIEHEGVIGIRTMRDANVWRCPHALSLPSATNLQVYRTGDRETSVRSSTREPARASDWIEPGVSGRDSSLRPNPHSAGEPKRRRFEGSDFNGARSR